MKGRQTILSLSASLMPELLLLYVFVAVAFGWDSVAMWTSLMTDPLSSQLEGVSTQARVPAFDLTCPPMFDPGIM